MEFNKLNVSFLNTDLENQSQSKNGRDLAY